MDDKIQLFKPRFLIGILFILSLVFLCLLVFTHRATYSSSEDVYDVILFWGQSNMVGFAGNMGDTENIFDSRVTTYDEIYGKDGFSYFSKIGGEIVNNYSKYNQVNINYEQGTVFNYDYFSNSLVDLHNAGYDYKLGECIYVDTSGGNLSFVSEKSSTTTEKCAIQKAKGTNIAQYFSKIYSSLSDRKVVIILAGNGGQYLHRFLPHDRILELVNDSSNYAYESGTYDANQYIYEAMVEKYNAAINYMSSHNMRIGRKFYVSMQGEADSRPAQYYPEITSNYVDFFEEIHNNFISQLGLEFGVLIETSRQIGGGYKTGVDRIHNAQETLISSNNDIILGSDFSYDHFYATEAAGSTIVNGKTEIDNSLLAVCDPTDNTIHFTSAGLSQIGKEAAISTFGYLNNNTYVNVVFHKMDGSGAVVNQYFRHKIDDTEKMQFGYEMDGMTPMWEQTGQFGTWDRIGYKLLGWSFSPYEATNRYRPYNTVSDDWINNNSPSTDLYAIWDLRTYNINYNLNGGTGNNETSYTIESDAITLVNPTKYGYIFAGWTGSNGEVAQMNVTIPKGSYGDRTYIANWIPQKYTVIFDSAGGSSVASQMVDYSGKVVRPSNPSKSGYIFGNWTLDGQIYDFSSEVTGDITLVAVWNPVTTTSTTRVTTTTKKITTTTGMNTTTKATTTTPNVTTKTTIVTPMTTKPTTTVKATTTYKLTPTTKLTITTKAPTTTKKSTTTVKATTTAKPTIVDSTTTKSMTTTSIDVQTTLSTTVKKTKNNINKTTITTEISENPKTGSVAIIIAWIVGSVAIGCSFMYFKQCSGDKI